MRHILLTNDDGVESPGLAALAAALEPLGRLSVIAPDRNRSGIGRGITINGPLHVEEAVLVDGRPALATDGTPVDCVRFAALGLFGEPPDVVVSGINLGMNLGDDVTYSGTVAAALEGVLLGVPSIAASQSPVARTAAGPIWDFRASADFVARLVPMASDIDFPRHVVLSVNAPGLPPEGIRGARLTRLGRRIYDDQLILEAEQNGRRRYSIYGMNPSHHREEGTDFAAVEAGQLSVTPIHFDLTDIAEMSRLERLQLNDLLGAEAAPADR
jgi:5'-nucleotidase